MTESSTVTESVGDDVFDIPGIGLIRARALKKAGFETISSLKGVDSKTISDIRGLTPLKADQIVEFVAGWQPSAAAAIVEEDDAELDLPELPQDALVAVDLESELLELEGICRVSLDLLETWSIRKPLRRELKNWIELLDKKLKRGKVARKYHPPAADHVEFLISRLEIQNLVLENGDKGSKRIIGWLEFQRRALEALL